MLFIFDYEILKNVKLFFFFIRELLRETCGWVPSLLSVSSVTLVTPLIALNFHFLG